MAHSAVQQKAEQLAAEHAAWVEWGGRLGFAARAVVYGAVGSLAAAAAWSGGRAEGSEGAIREIGRQPFGQTLLWLIALGLAGYAFWRFVQAAVDPDRRGSKWKDIVRRLGYAVSGVIHLSLAAYAAPITWGASSGGNSEQGWAAKVLSLPGGWGILALVGAAVIGFAGFELYSAYTQRFLKDYKLHKMNDTERKTARYAGILGLTARGVTFLIVGAFVIVAAIKFDPGQVKGFGEALEVLARQPYGPWLLALTGLGLVCFAVYCATQAFYRRFAV